MGTVTVSCAPAGFVRTSKLTVVLPSAIVTLSGTTTSALLPLDRFTSAPPAGAGPLNVIVARDPTPAATAAGSTTNPFRPGAGWSPGPSQNHISKSPPRLASP